MEWLAVNHVAPAVVVMSINGRRKEAINIAVENLIKKYHIHVIVASGNSNSEACGTSPASVPSAITVGAVDIELRRYRKSNWCEKSSTPFCLSNRFVQHRRVCRIIKTYSRFYSSYKNPSSLPQGSLRRYTCARCGGPECWIFERQCRITQNGYLYGVSFHCRRCFSILGAKSREFLPGW